MTNNYTSSKGGHKFGEYRPIYTGRPQTEMKDASLRMERLLCGTCRRRTPHKLGICQWHAQLPPC